MRLRKNVYLSLFGFKIRDPKIGGGDKMNPLFNILLFLLVEGSTLQSLTPSFVALE